MPGSQTGRQKVGCRGERRGRSLVWLGGFIVWLAGGMAIAPAAHASARTKQPVPEVRLELEDLGFPGVSPTFIAAGGSMLTVHFVDSEHLLVTFSLRGLVPRVADDPPGDDDRMVAGELVELASGKILARTEWHLHDHARYLWDLGDGRFMLRVRDSLSTFSPMANLAEGRAFERTVLNHRPGTVEAVMVSADSKLLTLETRTPQPAAKPKDAVASAVASSRPSFAASANAAPAPEPAAAEASVETPSRPPVALDFYRLSGQGTRESPLVAESVAAIGANSAIGLPVDADGYLRASDQPHNRWNVAFEPFGGKEIPLAPMESTCPPTLMRVGGGQLVALTCRGITGRVALLAFDFEKHEMWEEPLAASPLPPAFAMAPAAGRFAISRINSIVTDATFESVPDASATQDVRVYQTQTGDLLLKVSCSPVYRTAENFDLSADGMRVAVVREDAIEVYRLPQLTKGDREDLAELQKVTPPASAGRIDLSGLAEAGAKGEATASGRGGPPSSATANGDPQTPRKPPSLLNPGEKPEFQDKSATPN